MLTADFVQACRKSPSLTADTFAFYVLARVSPSGNGHVQFALNALDSGRVRNMNSPMIEAIESLFSSRKPLGENSFEVSPASCNEMRLGLYQRTASRGHASNLACRLLARLECQRRESGRPADEPRHPSYDTDADEWMVALAVGDVGPRNVERVEGQ